MSLVVSLLTAEFTVRVLQAYDLLRKSNDSSIFPPVRYAGKFRPSPDPKLLFELDPESPLINAEGFRDRDYPVARSDAIRILALGDSVTFGRGVPLEDTYVKVLERLLNESGSGKQRYEVMNLGIPGYNTRQEMTLYDQKGRKYAPDLVLIGYTLNDVFHPTLHLQHLRHHDVSQQRRRSRRAEGQPGQEARREAPSNGFHLQSELLILIRDRLRWPLEDSEVAVPTWPPPMYSNPDSWGIVSESFEELAKIAAVDGARVLIVIFPEFVQLRDYPFRDIHQKVAREAHRNGFSVLDLYEDFKSHDERQLRFSPRDTVHPSRDAHRLAAESIHRFIVRANILPESAGTPSAAVEERPQLP